MTKTIIKLELTDEEIALYATFGGQVGEKAREAIDDRKSKLEEWQETINEAAEEQSYEETLLDDHWHQDLAKLLGAAPQMLKTLLDLMSSAYCKKHLAGTTLIENAIHAAVPEDVAKELLGE